MSTKTNVFYNERTWLNDFDSSSTGSIVTYDGDYQKEGHEIGKHSYLEIADCQGKISLHNTVGDADSVFIDKMKLLRKEIDLFIKHLEVHEKS